MVSSDRVGIKLSPFHPYGDTIFDNPVAAFIYLFKELNKLDFALELTKKKSLLPFTGSLPFRR